MMIGPKKEEEGEGVTTVPWWILYRVNSAITENPDRAGNDFLDSAPHPGTESTERVVLSAPRITAREGEAFSPNKRRHVRIKYLGTYVTTW